MEISNQEVEIPIPINSSYGHGHGHMVHHEPAPPHHNHIIPSNGPHIVVPTTTALEEVVDQDHHNVPYNNNNNKIRRASTILYRECLKNHAASMGGNATDGCGEFMPSGLEGTLEALTCSACHCHRNFHRKEVEGEPMINPYDHCYLNRVGLGRKVILGHHKAILGPESVGYPTRAAGPLVPHQQHQMMMSSYHVNSESDDQEGSGGVGVMGNRAMTGQHHQGMMKKRFRTKFSQEQKEKMLGFAERVGWKIQKQEESVVQQFCQEIGVKRRVLKVWMHNNKHNLAKKNSSINAQDDHM